jgi:predicted MFS family arabinose efflux permease
VTEHLRGPDADARVAEQLSTGREAVLAGVLLLAMFVGIFPQYALGVLAPLLTAEVGISEWQLGVIASCLHISAALVARLTGRRLDTMSGRVALLLLFCTATGSLLLLAASRSIAWVVVSVVLGGVAIGANNPVTNRLVADHVRAGRRGRLISVKQVGVKLSHVTSGILLPAMALTLGWRLGLSVFAVAVLAAAMLALPLVPAGRPASSGIAADGADANVGVRVRWLRHYALLMATGMAAITTYLPLYAVQVVGMSLSQAGLVVTVLGLTGVVLRLVWGHLADRGMPPAGLLVVLGAIGGLSLLGTAAAAPVGSWLLWLSAVLAGVSLGSWNVLAHITVVNEIAAGGAAPATGLV